MDTRSRIVNNNPSVPCTNGTLGTYSVLDVTVGAAMHYSDTDEACKVNLLEWLKTEVFKEEIARLRSLTNKEDRNKIKATLPVITPSGLFNKKISERYLICHSGLLAFDIDLKDNLHIDNYTDLKEELSKIPNIAYCGLSASGLGYWGLVKIENPKKHKEHFEALYQAFNALGIVIDKKPSNVASKRGCSYDPDAYFNHDPVVFKRCIELNTHRAYKPYLEIKKRDHEYESNHNKFYKYVNVIVEQEIDITYNYTTWFEIGCVMANSFGEEGRNYFHLISQFHPNYTEVGTDKLFTRCLTNYYPYTMGTFYFYCNQEGIIINE